MADCHPAEAKVDLYAPDAAVEVWSNSDNAWCLGNIKSIAEGLATVEYTKSTDPQSNNNVVIKVLPVGHQNIRPAGQASASKSAAVPGAVVEVWSNTDGKWCEGKVLAVENDIVSLEYARDVGGSSSKVVKSLPLGHPDFRPSTLPVCSQPPDTPNKNVSVDSAPLTPVDAAPLTLDERSDFAHVCFKASMLSALSGAVNAVAVLELGMPVAHHTGNANGVGRELGVSGLRFVPSIAGYFLGAASAGYGHCSGDAVFDGHASGGLFLSAGTVAAGVLVQFVTGRNNLSVPLLAFSQGLQNGITTAFSGMALRTSHVTGCLSDAGIYVGALLRSWRDEQRAPKLRKPMLNAIVLLSFITGGFAGARAQQLIGVKAALPPAALLAFLATGLLSNRSYRKKHD